MKAALYCRTSSDMQKDNYSIPAQLNELRQYCIKNAIEIFEEYIDEGYTSKNDKRPAFRKMISDAENKSFDMILVHEYSRFASNEELSKALEEKLKKNNVTVISLSDKIDDGTANGFFQRLIVQGLAQWRLMNLAEHVKKSQKFMAENGLNFGSSCFGYDMVNKRLVINQEEAKIVKIIFKKYLSGEGGMKIQKWLNEKNILTRRGNEFKFGTIIRMLRNVKYCGRIKYCGKVYEGQHESIISDEDFQKVQRELKNKCEKNFKGEKVAELRRRSKRHYKFYLLGVLYCGECGSHIGVRKVWSNKLNSYCCARAMMYVGKCKFTTSFISHKLENDIEMIIEEFLQGKISFSAKLNVDNETKNVLERRLNKIPEEIKKVQQGFLIELFSAEEAKNKKIELEKEEREIKKELANIKNNIFDIDIHRKKVKTIWDEFLQSDVCRKRELLKSVVDRIYIYRDGRIEIVFIEK